MSQPTVLSKFLSATAKPLAATTLDEFLVGIRRGYDDLYGALMNTTDQQEALDALDEAFAQTRRSPRQRRILELCAWPIFDKPALPPAEASLPEFLWLFAVPVLVQLPQARDSVLMVPGDCLDMARLIETLEDSGCMNPKALVSGFSTLYSRDDLHAYGPLGIAQRFVDAETQDEVDLPLPLPIVQDPDIESGRTVTLYALLAARLPAGERVLFDAQKWPTAQMDKVFRDGLAAGGIEHEALQSTPGCSMSEALFRCAGPGLRELESWVDLGVAHYDLKAMYVTMPVEGMAELVGVTAKGEELMLAPTFAYVEPSGELVAACERVCQSRNLPFRGMFVSAVPTSSTLH